MLERLNEVVLAITDPVLGWMLLLPPSVALIALALLSAVLMLGLRLLVTDQDFLRRCADDKSTLKQLVRRARREKGRRGAREDVSRYVATKNMVAIRGLGAEGKMLLAAIVPIALLGTWAMARLAYLAPAAGEPVTMRLYLPVSADGSLAQVVPREGLNCESGWLRAVVPDKTPEGVVHNTVAEWQLVGRGGTYEVAMRHGRQTYQHTLQVGSRRYSAPVLFHTDAPNYDPAVGVPSSEVVMQPVKLFGLVPGLGAFLPPWLVAYVVLIVPIVLGLKRVFGVY